MNDDRKHEAPWYDALNPLVWLPYALVGAFFLFVVTSAFALYVAAMKKQRETEQMKERKL